MALRLFLLLSLFSTGINAGIFDEVISNLDMRGLAQTFSELQVNRVLDGAGLDLTPNDRRSAAALVALGVLTTSDLLDPARIQEKVNSYLEVTKANHPSLLGRVGDTGLPLALDRAWQHHELENDLLGEILASRLSAGVATGYDVRRRGIYDGLRSGSTVTYSHSSLLHLKQLVSLLAAEELSAWVYAAPKLAAFLYREEWGGIPEKIKTLKSGVKVIETQELVVLFQFASPDDRIRFHRLILKHAKRDSKYETGLVADAWWQPFYYTDKFLDGFEAISLVLLDFGSLEVTLTVPDDRVSEVVKSFRAASLEPRIKRVWVNPAFHRFLGGGYR